MIPRANTCIALSATNRIKPDDREANRDLLDHGTLSVARFEDDGRLVWLPLVQGREKLGKKEGFHSQADIVIEARRAGDSVGATPLDRPEDVEVHAASGRVFVMLTNNSARLKPNEANPRIQNLNGHILELQAPAVNGKFDHTADEFRWDIFSWLAIEQKRRIQVSSSDKREWLANVS